MGEIRIVGPGERRGYPYPVCKISHSLKLLDYLFVHWDKPWYNYYLVYYRGCKLGTISYFTGAWLFKASLA